MNEHAEKNWAKGVKWEKVNYRVPSCRYIVLHQEKVASAPVSSSFPTTSGGRVSSSKHQPCKGVCETGSVPGPGLPPGYSAQN